MGKRIFEDIAREIREKQLYDSKGQDSKGFSTAEARWARFGPYYAMFPLEFAFNVVEEYSKEGDYIIDPFAGRCSSIYAGGVLGRNSLGIEINPVGWLYGKSKTATSR